MVILEDNLEDLHLRESLLFILMSWVSNTKTLLLLMATNADEWALHTTAALKVSREQHPLEQRFNFETN